MEKPLTQGREDARLGKKVGFLGGFS